MPEIQRGRAVGKRPQWDWLRWGRSGARTRVYLRLPLYLMRGEASKLLPVRCSGQINPTQKAALPRGHQLRAARSPSGSSCAKPDGAPAADFFRGVGAVSCCSRAPAVSSGYRQQQAGPGASPTGGSDTPNPPDALCGCVATERIRAGLVHRDQQAATRSPGRRRVWGGHTHTEASAAGARTLGLCCHWRSATQNALGACGGGIASTVGFLHQPGSCLCLRARPQHSSSFFLTSGQSRRGARGGGREENEERIVTGPGAWSGLTGGAGVRAHRGRSEGPGEPLHLPLNTPRGSAPCVHNIPLKCQRY